MCGKYWQLTGLIFVILMVLSGVNSRSVAQTPSNQSQCTEIEMKNHVNQLDKANPSAYDALVVCKDKAIPELIKALKNQNKQVRIMAITALGEIASPDAVLPLSNLLSTEGRWDVRTSIIFALSKFGKQGVLRLITALKDKDWYIRYQAANALNEIGFDAKDAIPALNDAVKDENINVRSAATTALLETKKATCPPFLVNVEVDVGPQTAVRRTGTGRTATNTLATQSKAPLMCRSASTTGTTIRVESAIHPPPPSSARTVTQKITIQPKTPLMCRYPVLRTIFKWKCG